MEKLLLNYILVNASGLADFLESEGCNYPDRLSALQDFMQDQLDNKELTPDEIAALNHLTKLILEPKSQTQ